MSTAGGASGAAASAGSMRGGGTSTAGTMSADSGGTSAANAGAGGLGDTNPTAGASPGGNAGMAAMPAVGGTAGNPGENAGDGDAFVSDVSVEVHESIRTILVVSWTQTMAADETFLQFSFDDTNVMSSRPQPGQTGAHRDVVLGAPGETLVTLQIVSSVGGSQFQSGNYQQTTGAIPAALPVPEVMSYDAARASPDRWLFGMVEDSTGGGDVDYYRSTCWLYIMDRQGRMVWYWSDLANNPTFGFQRIAPDGEYVVVEQRPFGAGGTRGVVKMTLDQEYFEQIDVPNLSDCIDVTDDGSLLYDDNGTLIELSATGSSRTIWSCREHFGQGFNCYSNTVNWTAQTNTVFLSFPEPGTVVEVDRETGELVGQYGNAPGSWAFAPPVSSPPDAWGFGFQHFPNYSPSGTLMLSSHMPGYEETSNPVANQHAFLEFAVDRDTQTLTEVWRYTEGPEWAHAKGMAVRLANGNTLANYGTGGVVREITPDKDTVFYVKFDTPTGSDFYNKMVGNSILIDDLYALNGGPE